MKIPEVSVVITCFNYGKYLKECLESVLNQSFTDLEIIIVNDGSTDNTDQVISNFRALDNIKYIKQSNSGQAKAKNIGVKYSSGRLIAFLDADDAWDRDKLAKQIPLFLKEKTGVVYSRARYVDEQGKALKTSLSGKYLLPRSGNVVNYLFLDNFVPFSSSIVRRVCLEQCGIFNESYKMGIDWDLWLRVATCYDFDFIDEPLLIYRVGHVGQMSKNIELRQHCSDQIMSNFIRVNQGLIPLNIVRKAYAYTYCNRGEYYRTIDRKKSAWFFLKSIQYNLREMSAYKGLVKTILEAVKK